MNWFADRIEIISPGGLYEEAQHDFPKSTAYRNPIIAEAMKTLGYVNKFGRGIARAQKALAENGSYEAEFDCKSNHVYVLIRKR